MCTSSSYIPHNDSPAALQLEIFLYNVYKQVFLVPRARFLCVAEVKPLVEYGSPHISNSIFRLVDFIPLFS